MPQPNRCNQDMYPLVEIYLQGHHTQQVFCDEYEMTTSVLNYWLAKYRKQAAQVSDAFLEIGPSTSVQDQAFIEIQYPHGVRLRLFRSVSVGYVEQLVRLT
jgi:hypothetical protein